MTEYPSPPADARPSSVLPLLVAFVALVVAVGALWVSYGGARPAVTQEQAAVAPPADLDKIKQDLASLQQTVQGIQADQQKQAGEAQQKISKQQGEQKLMSEQLGSLSARVNALESARAESSAAAPQSAPRAKGTKR